MDVTKPYKFIGFGAMDVTKLYEFIGFGAMDVTNPYEFTRFGPMDVTKPCEFIGFGAMVPGFCFHVPAPALRDRPQDPRIGSDRALFDFCFGLILASSGPALGRIEPYEFIRFGAMDVTKPYEFIGFGAMDVTTPYEFIGFGAYRCITTRRTNESGGLLHPQTRRLTLGG